MSKTATRNAILSGLQGVGLGLSDLVLVHSSLKSLGTVDGGAETVIEALLEAVGSSGTLLIPTFTGSSLDSQETPPRFDVLHSPGYTGWITECFRNRPGVIRSLHPTHSIAALGPLAASLLRDHEKSPTPCGWNTPFGRLIENDGKILFLGVGLESCTLLHSCEEFAAVDYHMQPNEVDVEIRDTDGSVIRSRIGIHWWNPDAERDYPAIEPLLLKKKAMTVGKAENAVLRLVSARRLVEIVMPLLERDPTILLKDRRSPVPMDL